MQHAGATAFQPATSQLRLGNDGVIHGPTGPIGQMDANFNFTLQLGGHVVQGNLVELMVRSIVERMMGQMAPQLGLGQLQPGAPYETDGRRYITMNPQGPSSPGTFYQHPQGPSSPGTFYQHPQTPLSHPTTGVPNGRETQGANDVTESRRPRGSTAEENATLPIWGEQWDDNARRVMGEVLGRDTSTIEQKRAALARFTAFSQEMYGGPAPSYQEGYQSGWVHNMFGTGAIYDERYYSGIREQKAHVTSEYQRLLGREPTRSELAKWMYGSANLAVNESEFERNKAKLSEMTPAGLQAVAAEIARNPNTRETERGVGDQLTDGQVAQGVRDYLAANPNATEAQIRQVARQQYGISESQLDRVKANFFSSPTAPVTTAPVTTAPVTTAPVTTAPVTTAPVTTAPVTTAPVTTSRPAQRYSDNEVADGVREYIRNNPGASEAQIRQVAQSQYGISTDQLDRVKRDHFS